MAFADYMQMLNGGRGSANSRAFDASGLPNFDWASIGSTPMGAQDWGNTSFEAPDLSAFAKPGAGSGLGWNMPTAQLGLDGLRSIGGLYMGMNQLGLAKKQYAFQSGLANKNLANQTQTYNTALEDKARSRGVAEGQSQSQVDDYIKKNSLSGKAI